MANKKVVPFQTVAERDAVIARLRQMFQYVAVVEGTANAYSDATKAQTETNLRRQAKRTGSMIEWTDGSREFYRLDTIFNGTGEHGGYIWSAKGDKVKARRTRIIVTPDGQRDEQVIWEGFMDFDKATGE